MWPFTKSRQVDVGRTVRPEEAWDVVRQEIRALRARVEDLEDLLQRLDLRFSRLRGQVTGALRRQDEEGEYDDDSNEDSF